MSASFFPHPDSADRHGLVAVTHAINADLLEDAYAHGIFPWSEDPVGWFSPDPRAIFVRDQIRMPRKLGKIMRRHRFRVTFDTAFDRVMRACAETHEKDGTWITAGFFAAYGELFERGHAHSVEVWQDEALVGGLYGVQLRGLFAGESMFHRVPNASKVAFGYLVRHLEAVGTLLFDAQVPNDFTLQLGAVLVRRATYLATLKKAMRVTTLYDGGRWPAAPLTALDRS
ncbi:MAG: leucyl/phenylalanyl-tRNA--protein transferase [Deltaproteobacteria bacterium]|nr:leucyl/phenylalanyl-tRNA--protein transferase [Deltaproteobacteria bacterium]